MRPVAPAPISGAGDQANRTPNSASSSRIEILSPLFWTYLGRLEWVVVSIAGCLAVALHLRFVTHVGGLWRDETNSANLATLSSFGEMWRSLDYDSFPFLFFLLLRSWLELFGSHNDAALRTLGCLTGLGILAVLWINAHSLGARLPVLSLALIGLNPMLIRYGDSARAYGLGIFLILLTFRSFWRLVDAPSPPAVGRVVAAAALALLSVQCLYYNSVLLLAISAGAVAVAWRRRAYRTAGIVVAIGLLSAVSLVPYVPMMRRMHEWSFLVNFPVDFKWLWTRGCEVIGSPDSVAIWLWVALFLTSLILLLVWVPFTLRHRLLRDREKGELGPISPNATAAPQRRTFISSAVLYAGVCSVVGVIGYAGFLKVLNYYTQPWYYITLVAFVACTLDVVFGVWSSAGKVHPLSSLRILRLAIAIIFVALAGLPAWAELPTRHTNVDLLAARIEPLGEKGDVILVPRWECAITLCRYYGGPAEVVTLPPIRDHRFHRYDLVLRQIKMADPIQPVLAKLETVLRSGHRVFVAGTLPFPLAPPVLPAKPPIYRDPLGGWHGVPYDFGWPLQVGHFLRVHATSAGPIELSPRLQVQDFENLELVLVQGWKP